MVLVVGLRRARRRVAAAPRAGARPVPALRRRRSARPSRREGRASRVAPPRRRRSRLRRRPVTRDAAAARGRLARRAAKSRAGFIGKLEGLLRGKSALDQATLDEVEAVLFGADLGVRTADEFLAVVQKLARPDEVRGALEARAQEILGALPSAVVAARARSRT